MSLTYSKMLPLNTELISFDLPNVVTGDYFSNNHLDPSKPSLIMFICNHCPYVIHYHKEIKRFANDFENDINIVAISSNETLVESTSEKINSLKDKLIDGSISTNKEYDAMMETIDFEKNLLSEKENELIELMSKKEELEKEIEEDTSALDGIITELTSKKEALNKKMQEVAEEQNALETERQSVVKNIDSDTMLKYSEIYEAREGLVAVEILDGSCGGCGAMVPPQLINEAISQNIVYCGNCSRFLYKIEN